MTFDKVGKDNKLYENREKNKNRTQSRENLNNNHTNKFSLFTFLYLNFY